MSSPPSSSRRLSLSSVRFVAWVLPFALVACSSANQSTANDGGKGTGDDGTPDGSTLEPDGAVIGPDGAALGDGAGPGDALCSVTSQGTAGVVLSGTLLLGTGPTVGELFIGAAGTIACAAASCAATAGYAAATQIACPNGVISPSLVNTHDHTEYATRGPETLPTTRYQHRNDWRLGDDGATALPKVSSTTDAPTIAAQELRFVMGGATSVIGSGGVGGLMRNLADYSNQAFLEGLTGKVVHFDTFPMGDSSLKTLINSGCAYPSITATGTAFEDGVYAPHIAEGINLGAENELTCANQTTNQLITANTSVIHGVGTNANDVAKIATAGAKLIWAPRSNISLYGDTAPVTEYHTAGVTIALGTDWLASGSMNMLRELSCADSMNQKYFHQTFTDQELWEMVTKNAGIASGFGAQIGTLDVGKVGDVAVFDGTTNTSYRAVIAAGNEDVHLVLRGGKVLYGDANLVSALSSTCTALTVCGIARSVCVDTPSVTLAQIQAIGTSVYPIFSCKGTTPTNEPSCVPYRDTYPNGTSATDGDGDGVPDSTDDCPTIFNPPRPMDNANDPDGGAPTAQADVDGDGVGDVCDAKPLDNTAH
jgi:hypothetical protein